MPRATLPFLLSLLCATAAHAAAPAAPPSWSATQERGLLAVEPPPTPAPRSVVLRNAAVMTAAGAVHSPGYAVLVDGAIASVGPGEPASIPDGAAVLDLDGAYITPGIIDTHSHLGVYASPGGKAHGDGNEATAPTTAGVWAEHSVWPQDPGFEYALAGGITALQILPGSANLIGGRGVVLQNVPRRGARAMRLPGAPETVKMACGENPKRVYGDKGGPSTRMGNVRAFRAAWIKAEAKRREWDAAEARAGKPGKKKKGAEADAGDAGPERDLDLETLVGVLRGEILPQIHCYQADDMLDVLQVADEFGWTPRGFHHCLEAYKIRDVLAARGISCSTWADWWGFKLEAYDGIPHNAALLTEAGARAVIHSDSAEGIQRLNQEAAKALRYGRQAGIELTEDQALRWITANPAWTLGIDGLTGTLEPGKRADVVVWTGHPFSVTSRARYVFVAGELQYDLERPRVRSDFRVGQEVQP
jgi:imidazolonepropionase-like amidohydrolase